MGVGYLGLADRTDHTASSEWSSRQGEAVTTLQVHHTAYPSDTGSRALMDPGGRTVSANYLLLKDGTLVEVVPGQYRAFTSASGADRYCLTVETVNQTGSPEWGISETQRKRLAKLAADMRRAGLGINPGRRGVGGIIGHSETPGSYATACPGPDMNLDHIAAMAADGSYTAGGGSTPIEEEDMPKAKLYRNADNGDMRIMNPETGLEFGIPHPDYVDLVVGWKLFDGITSNAPTNLPGNIFEFVRTIGASVRASSPVDAGAIAATVSGQVTEAVKTALADLEFDGDAEAIAAKVESILADDFAGIPAAVVDEQRDRLTD
jgi:hypothetical protein